MKARNGQSTFELTLTIVVVIGAVIAMAIFMKRSVMGKLRETGTQVGEQFSPVNTTSKYTRTFTGAREETLTPKGYGKSAVVGGKLETQDRKGDETVDVLSTDTLF